MAGLCHCGIVVMVCVGGRACGVYCLLSTVYCLVLWCVFQCGACVVLLCCGLWNSGGLVACLPLSSVFLFLLFVLVFGVVRAQPCEHARYPRTPMCSLVVFPCCVPFSLLPAFLHAPPFFCWNGGVRVYHVSVCCVGMTATGSLSRSSSFFW